MYKETVYNNPVEASEMVRILKRTEMRPDHLPFPSSYNYKKRAW
jgi:hypothetical protein